MRGGGTQTADFFGFGGGTGLTFGLGRVFGGTFFESFPFPVGSESSLPLKDVLAMSVELSRGLKKVKLKRPLKKISVFCTKIFFYHEGLRGLVL
jgi:hypothetical protein